MATITLYFLPGTDSDIAQVQVQNKVQLATPSLPAVVQQSGITVTKSARNFLMIVTLFSEDGSMDEIGLGNYIAVQRSRSRSAAYRCRRGNDVRQPVCHAHLVESGPAQSYNLTPKDVVAAIRAQNIQVPVGRSAPSVRRGAGVECHLRGRTTLRTPEEFSPNSAAGEPGRLAGVAGRCGPGKPRRPGLYHTGAD